MTRQPDLLLESRQQEKDMLLVRACEFELIGSLSAAGADLSGFSAKIDQFQCLITLRAFVDDCNQVSFVSSDTLPDALRKCVRMAHMDQLKWTVDKWAK